MRTSEASLAVARRSVDGRPRWLALWNAKWAAYHFVGGHRNPEETFRACIIREVFEELGLQDGLDCHVSPAPLAHLAYNAWSSHARAETAYVMELFSLALEPRAEPALQSDPAVRWLADGEILDKLCRDGRPVSPTMGFLIAKAGLV